MSKGVSLFLWFVVFILILITIGFGFYDYYVTSYKYESVIGSYMDNSVDSISPELMLQQIQLAEDGMRKEGLIDSDYGAWFFKKPDNSMKFQYQHIDGIKERIQAVIDWKTKISGNNTSVETLGDVYETKMTNLRNYINEGGVRSDWIAKKAWNIKYHPILYWSVFIYGFLIFLIIIVCIIAGEIYDN